MGGFWYFYIFICFTVIGTESSINLALRKPAHQSSDYPGFPWTAGKAVDGTIRFDEPLRNHNACSITEVNPNITTVWWYLDLLDITRILFVKILYRPGFTRRFAGYSLSISRTSWNQSRTLCFKDNGGSILPANQTLVCNMTGRYVTIYNERNPVPGNESTYVILELCEVEVYGCPFGKYGDSNCNSYCSVGCVNGDCESHNGICIYGCQDGWMNPKCDVCKDGRYGSNCEFTCSSGCASTCNKMDGRCNCTSAWKGPKCNDCFDGKYGNECDKNCSIGCSQIICGRSDGTCTCNKQWAGTRCERCITGRYGSICELECSPGCLNNMCNKQQGSCDCKAGWTGTTCKLCADGFHGSLCEHKCSSGCDGTSCNRTDGTCDCLVGWSGSACEVSSLDGTTSDNTGVVVGVAIALIALIAIGIGIGVFILIKRRKLRANPEKVVLDDLDNLKGKESRFSSAIVNQRHSEIYENSNDNPALKHVIHLDNIQEEVNIKKEDLILNEEFKDIPYGALNSHSAAEKQENESKNRYKTTLAYDHSRVLLHHAKSDYINANYIKGIDEQRKYIATQGPKKTTIDDFWQMIWQEQSPNIVMVTKLVEGARKKCEKYWPDHLKPLVSDGLEIELQDEMTYSFFEKRNFLITQKETKKTLQVAQLHFTTWPDHGTPDPLELMLFHRKYKALMKDRHGLPTVHCSAGVGRTGTFIALDALIESASGNGEINVFDCVAAMRRDRMNMVQTVEQYVVLHDALVEALDFEDTTIKIEDFCKTLNECKGNTPANQSRVKLEFQNLHAGRPRYKVENDYKAAMLKQNRNKNRPGNILALDKYRVFIMPRSSKDTNYINAVALPTYRKLNGLIVTQEPLENTILDFWQMVKEQGSSTIVCLDMGLKVPDESSQVEIFSVANWHQGVLPTNKHELLRVIEKVKNANQAEDSGPITVVCRDGATCCGSFCIIYNSIQRLQADGDVDIYQTARQLLKRRPEFCRSKDSYEFCYDVIMEYINSTDIYSN